jgi:hypothetical protein
MASEANQDSDWQQLPLEEKLQHKVKFRRLNFSNEIP